MLVRKSPLPLPSAPLAVLIFAVLSSGIAAQQETVLKGRYVLHADAAWVRPGVAIEPAYVTVRDGVIQSVRRQAPRGGVKIHRVAGTLAPALVDAWTEIMPAQARTNRQFYTYSKWRDELPGDLEIRLEDWSPLVEASREVGIGAAFFSSGASSLSRGLGTPVTFNAYDLPVAAGTEALEFALGSATTSGANAVLTLERFGDLLVAADAYGESQEEFEDKLEKYEKDLEEYEKKFEEYLEKKNKAEKNGKKNGQSAADKNGKEKNGKDKKELKAPKRPTRPKTPNRDPSKEILLQALKGEWSLRVEAHEVFEIQRLLEWQRKYGFDLVLVGGSSADLLAEELKDADVSVILAVRPTGADGALPERSLAQRFQTLHDAEVKVALASGGRTRDQAFLLIWAGQLVASGLDASTVWAAMTQVPARMLNLQETHGELRAGASADLLLFGGSSPFDASGIVRSLRPGSRLP